MKKHLIVDKVKNNCLFVFYPTGILKSVATSKMMSMKMSDIYPDLDPSIDPDKRKNVITFVKAEISDFKFLTSIQQTEGRKLIYIGDIKQHLGEFSPKVSMDIDSDTNDIILRNINMQ